MEDNDAQLQLKKRARRRLVGAVFFASVVAIVLPMVMDQDPRPPVQDVEIRIPGQDDRAFAPTQAVAPAPQESPADEPRSTPLPRPEREAPPAAAPEATARPLAPTARVLDSERVTPARSDEKPKVEEKTKVEPKPKPASDKDAPKPAKSVDKPAEDKNKVKPADDEARRAAAILAGKPAEASQVKNGGEFLILIGAFSDPVNVANLKKKLGEQGIKTFTEPLDTPQGKKTRVRAGPFPNRDAAEKALDKMRRIGVSGVVAAKS